MTGGRLNAANALAYAIRQNPNQDSDGDNYSNLFEYLANTLIDNAQTSKPAVFSDSTAGYLRIGVPSTTRSGASFIVEKSTDMKSWTTTGVTDFSSAGTLLKGISYSSGPTGFLRIRAVTVP